MRSITDRGSVRDGDGDAIMRTYRAGGAVHVSGVLGPELLADVREAADKVFLTWAALVAADALPSELASAWTRRFIPLTYLPIGADRIDALLPPCFRELARRYLDKEPEIEPNSHVRSIVLHRADAHLPFHQDQSILNRRLLNVWIPLVECGIDAPGLEVVWGSWTELVEPAPAPSAAFPVERARLDPAVIARRFGPASYWHPRFVPGDAMLFSGATVHRTFVTPEMTRDRMSVEFRLL